MKNLVASFLLFFISCFCFAQIQNDVSKILAKKNFQEFKSYSDKLSTKWKNSTSYWENLRDLTKGFQEGVFYFEQSVPHKDNPAISAVYTYRVNIIATTSTIIFYDLSEKKKQTRRRRLGSLL